MKSKPFTAKDLQLVKLDESSYAYVTFVHKSPSKSNSGHAVLIKKNADNNFAFYDPNKGAVFGLTEEQLCKIVTQVFLSYVKEDSEYKLEKERLDKIVTQESRYYKKKCVLTLTVFLTVFIIAAAYACYCIITNAGIFSAMTGPAMVGFAMAGFATIFSPICLLLVGYYIKQNFETFKSETYRQLAIQACGYDYIQYYNEKCSDYDMSKLPALSALSELEKEVEDITQKLKEYQLTHPPGTHVASDLGVCKQIHPVLEYYLKATAMDYPMCWGKYSSALTTKLPLKIEF
ncbi:hypothetical protein [Wolbachia endosymbiont of Ctenocephalides felis wCfeT]|uniref:hypothetical protein n=1 Tax=Wolbachia endosymbiont of Ctenocephalides felis wCfeT TaxID=2732593 RepID=UPI001447C93F|nr:hypothetical protein [Wolbachia endosymbiont of Ctenocephalides felis wCfeT]